MKQIKKCPECETEYFPHIERCADCGSPLLLPEEYNRFQEERQSCRKTALKNAVKLRQGDLKWMDELYNVLIAANIPCIVSSDDTCRKGCCGATCKLLVSASDAERANEVIEEYFLEVYPELKESKELISKGRCPACGTEVTDNAVECPDCGLALLIIE